MVRQYMLALAFTDKNIFFMLKGVTRPIDGVAPFFIKVKGDFFHLIE